MIMENSKIESRMQAYKNILIFSLSFGNYIYSINQNKIGGKRDEKVGEVFTVKHVCF